MTHRSLPSHNPRASRNLFGLIVATLISHSAWALPNDTRAPIQIEADKAELNQKNHTVVYKGKVRLTQGTIMLEADELTVTQTNAGNAGALTSAKAVGKPAHFSQQINPGEKRTHGYGQRIDYNAQKHELVFSNQAKLTQAANTVSGDNIVYDIDSGVIQAGQDRTKTAQSKPSRVKVVLQPASKPAPTATAQPNGNNHE